MPTVITYDVSDEKENEFKTWLKDKRGWLDQEMRNGELFSYPESTLMKPGTSNGNSDVNQAKTEMIEAAKEVKTQIESAIIVSTSGAFDYLK